MPKTEEILWGSYRNFEGPFWPGKGTPFVLPENPTENDKVLAVVTATEGGSYSAINMYDGSPILSSGLIQFIEGRGQRSVSQMIMSAGVRDDVADEGVLDPFDDFVESLEYDMTTDGPGKWFFCYGVDMTYLVDTPEEQNLLFRCGSNGEKGTWGPANAARAKGWAAAVATIWEHPVAQRAQREFTLPQLEMFAFGGSRKMITYAVEKDTDLSCAFVAAYLSFAVNNPTRANKHLHIGLEKARMKSRACSVMWSLDWLIEVFKELTFGPKIAIYPERYKAIRPELEKLYGIDLPDFADELRRWTEETSLISISTEELQKSLMALGEDLGPKGADGQYGTKTKNAVLNLETRMRVPVRLRDGMVDEFTFPALEEALKKEGLKSLRESS